MCLGIPMKVVKIEGGEGLVETGGLRRRADFSLLKGLKAGDYVILHAGFAIGKIKEEEAQKTLEILKEM